jgi:hypothetical protein
VSSDCERGEVWATKSLIRTGSICGVVTRAPEEKLGAVRSRFEGGMAESADGGYRVERGLKFEG